MDNHSVESKIAKTCLGMFPQAIRRMIVNYVQGSGLTILEDIEKHQRTEVKLTPALEFLPEDQGSRVIENLARAIRIVLGDALAGQWSTDKYALALSRTGGLSLEYATKLAQDRIVTEDAGVFDFARRLMNFIPDIPGPFDDTAIKMLGGALRVLDNILPTAMTNQSSDVLFEWNNMGDLADGLALRDALTKKEAAFQALAGTTFTDVKDAALATIPFLGRALLGLLGRRSETGDPAEEALVREVGDVLAEAGDLLSMARACPATEQGSLFSALNKFAKKATSVIAKAAPVLAPMATTALGVAVPGSSALTPLAAKLIGPAANHHSMKAAHAAADGVPHYTLPAAVQEAKTLRRMLTSVT